jgi:hypothetical protein
VLALKNTRSLGRSWIEKKISRPAQGISGLVLIVSVVGLQGAALKPRINPGGRFRPQTDVYGEQRVDFEAAQLPTLFTQLCERSPRRANELLPQLFIRQQAADNSFNRSM